MDCASTSIMPSCRILLQAQIQTQNLNQILIQILELEQAQVSQLEQAQVPQLEQAQVHLVGSFDRHNRLGWRSVLSLQHSCGHRTHSLHLTIAIGT